MKQLLEESLGCGCLTLDACQLVLQRSDPLSGQRDALPSARSDA
jgi:hypothetical protein